MRIGAGGCIPKGIPGCPQERLIWEEAFPAGLLRHAWRHTLRRWLPRVLLAGLRHMRWGRILLSLHGGRVHALRRLMGPCPVVAAAGIVVHPRLRLELGLHTHCRRRLPRLLHPWRHAGHRHIVGGTGCPGPCIPMGIPSGIPGIPGIPCLGIWPGNGYAPGAPGFAGFAFTFYRFLARIGLCAGLTFPGRLDYHQDDQHHDYAQDYAEKYPEIGGEHIEKGAALDREEPLEVSYLDVIVAGSLGGDGKYDVLAAGRRQG